MISSDVVVGKSRTWRVANLVRCARDKAEAAASFERETVDIPWYDVEREWRVGQIFVLRSTHVKRCAVDIAKVHILRADAKLTQSEAQRGRCRHSTRRTGGT